MTKRLGSAALVLLVFVVATGCSGSSSGSPFPPVGMSQTTGDVTFSLGCERDGIDDISVQWFPPGWQSGETSPVVIWAAEAESASGRSLETILLGQVPDGFVETTPLNTDLVAQFSDGLDIAFDASGYTGGFRTATDGVTGWAYNGEVNGTWESYQDWVHGDGPTKVSSPCS